MVLLWCCYGGCCVRFSRTPALFFKLKVDSDSERHGPSIGHINLKKPANLTLTVIVCVRTAVRSLVRLDGRTDGKFTPLFYRTSSPSGPLPKRKREREGRGTGRGRGREGGKEKKRHNGVTAIALFKVVFPASIILLGSGPEGDDVL